MVKNMMFYLLENRQIGDRDALETGVKDIASKGFDAILLQLRNTAFQLDDPEVIKSVAIIADKCHRLGLTITLTFITTNCRPWWFSFFKKYPKSGSVITKKAEGTTKSGKLKAGLTFPCDSNPIVGHFEGLFAGFAVKDGSYHKLPDFKPRYYTEIPAGIGDAGGWFWKPERDVTIEGNLPGVKDGDVVLYASFRVMEPDYASPEFAEFLDYLLEKYKDVKLDGVAWDEPSLTPSCGGPNDYRLSQHFCAKFLKEHGYDLRDKVYALDHAAPGSSGIRYDYFCTLRNVLYDAQKHFIGKARELFGQKIFSGIHHTLWGESSINDLWVGCIDYFALSDNLSGGFTDCVWADEKSALYTYRLAKSIGKYHPNKLSYSNCGDFCPSPEKTTYFSRMMAIWNIHWIGHAYGHENYPDNRTWKDLGACTKRVRNLSDFLGDAQEVAKIAVYHSWESAAQINNLFASLYKTTQLNLCLELVEHNLPPDFVGARELARSRPEKEILQIDDQRYAILIVPWPSLLPDQVWQRIKDYIRSGGKVIFIGPPALELTSGKNITKDFFDLTGVEPYSLEDYMANYLKSRSMPDERLRASRWLYPLRPAGSQPVFGDEYGIGGVKNGCIYYFSAVDPAKFILKTIADCGYENEVRCRIPNVLYSQFKQADAKFLCAAARYGQTFSGRFDFTDGFLEVEKAGLLCARVKKGEVTILGEEMGAIKSNWKIIDRKDL